MGEQNSACGAASNEITSTLQKNPWKSWKDNSGELSGADFSSDVRIEEVGTSKARPAAISDSSDVRNSWNYAIFLTQQVMGRKHRRLVTR
jgi:hypothetical protein